jgi:hypothetical protein
MEIAMPQATLGPAIATSPPQHANVHAPTRDSGVKESAMVAPDAESALTHASAQESATRMGLAGVRRRRPCHRDP